MEEDAWSRQVDVPGGFTLHICNQQPSITQVLRAVKRKEHGIFNCIASIIYDNKFIVQVSDNFASFPLLANLRAGAWYAGPRPSATCYFKSTDGHSGEWSFSTVRINLHVARLAARHGGVCIVDATRRGKTFPDALSKTVPIWAAVLNRAVARIHNGNASAADKVTISHESDVHLPHWISGNERNQILARIDQWVDDLFSVGADLSDLASSRSAWKPLRCAWVCRDDQQRWAAEAAPALPHTPIVLISASIPNARGRKRLCLDSHDKSRFNSSVTPIGRGLDHQGASISADTSESPPSRGGVAWQPIDVMFDYIPGAGDDEESWAKGMGLTPDIVWNHWKEILSAGPEGATEVVKHELRQQKRQARREMGRGDAEMNRGSQDRMYLGVDHPVLHPPPRVVWIGNTNLGLCSLHSSFLAVDHKDTGTSVDYPWDPSDAVINVSSADLLESAPQVGEPLAVDEIPACSDPKSSSSVFPDLPKLFIDKSDSFLLGKHYLWLPKAAYRGEKRSLLRHIPAAVTFASGHLSAGRRVVVVGEASNSVDIAACALLSCLIACFKLLEGDNGGPWMLEWSNSCDVNWETLTVKAVEGDRFSRLTVRQYAASSISLWAPEVVLPKMLLKQVFNAFLPNRMTAPGRRLE